MSRPKHWGFSLHFKEAIALYRIRKPLYSRASHGHTDTLFRKILLKQFLALPLAFILDLWAYKYQRAEIPIMVLDFVDMENVPSFLTSEGRPWPIEADFYTPDLKKIKSQMVALLRANDFFSLLSLAEAQLELLSLRKKTNAFYRHFMESIARISYLAPFYLNAAKEKKLTSPVLLIKAALYMHILFLNDSHRVDLEALKFQIQGLPVLVRDVPPIATRPLLTFPAPLE